MKCIFIYTLAHGMFTVDPMTGVVQTAAKYYKPGSTYRVFVQARDRTPTDPKSPQVTVHLQYQVLKSLTPQFL